MKDIYRCLAFLCCGVLAGTANAGPIGPVYPAPGGNSFSSTGTHLGDPGGKTFFYSNFDFSASSDLYWGLTSVLNGFNAGSTTQALSSFNSSLAVYTGTTTVDDSVGFIGGLQTETDIVLSGGATFQAPPAGTSGNTGVVALVTGDFSAHIQMYVHWTHLGLFGSSDPATGWYATNQLYNLLNTEFRGTTDSVSGAFWSDPPVASTPEPASLSLAGMGLVSLGAYALRRRSQKKQAC